MKPIITKYIDKNITCNYGCISIISFQLRLQTEPPVQSVQETLYCLPQEREGVGRFLLFNFYDLLCTILKVQSYELFDTS